MKAIDYLCIIVHWKNALPWRLVYNFGCLSLKIVKLAFHWRWIFIFVSGWRVAAILACSRLRDSGEKSFSKKKIAATAPFPRVARILFWSALFYLRAWHRLLRPWWRYSDRQVHGHYGVIGQTSHKNTDFFLFWPAMARKMLSYKGRKKKEYMLHCVFQEFILTVAIPEVTPETRILICLQIFRRSGRSAKVSYPG